MALLSYLPNKEALERALRERQAGSVASPGLTVDKTGPTYNTQPVSGGQTYGTTSSPVSTQQPQSSPVNATRPNYENVDQFDFNRNYEDTLDQLQRQRADATQQYDLTKQRLQEQYDRQFRDVRQAQQDATNLDAERLAGQGILRSGLAVKSAGEIGSRFGGELDNLQRQLSGQLEDVEGGYAAAQRQIQEQIGRAQEHLTRQQQMLEEQRARQLAAAQAAQRAAEQASQNAAEKQKQSGMIVKDNLGKYFLVDPTNKTRQQITDNNLGSAQQLYGPAISGLNNVGSVFGSDYVKNAEALARRLGGNLGGQASLDVRLGFRDLGAWR